MRYFSGLAHESHFSSAHEYVKQPEKQLRLLDCEPNLPVLAAKRPGIPWIYRVGAPDPVLNERERRNYRRDLSKQYCSQLGIYRDLADVRVNMAQI